MSKRWFLITLLYLTFIFIFIILAILGLGLFGIPGTILLATFVHFSPSYHAWLRRQPGYRQRLAWLPGFDHPNPTTAALTILAYFLPLSFFCLILSLPLLLENVVLLSISIVLAIIGFLWFYGWLVKGWRIPLSPSQKAADLRQKEDYFRRIRRLDQVKALDPVAFEHFVGALFAQMGYEVQTTALSGDEGIDLILYKGSHLAIVQCKRYSGTVGQPVIRDLYGAMVHNRAYEGYLVTTGAISMPARQWAANKPIHLIDGNGLLEWIETLKDASLSASQPGRLAWLQVGRELSLSLPAMAFITFALGFSLACCSSFFTILLIQQPLRQAGLLPPFTTPSIPSPAPSEPGSIATATPLFLSDTTPVAIAGAQIVNLRSGPGTEYEVIGALLPGENLEITGRNLDSSWWQVTTPMGPAWVSAGVVEAHHIDATLPVQIGPPTPTPTPDQ